MIHEPKNPDFNAIAAAQKRYNNPKYACHCGHSQAFWATARKAEFGDQILCEICNRYFAKIKNMAWVIPDTEQGNKPTYIRKGRSNHLGEGGSAKNSFKISDYYLTHVECRVTT